ncbi:hypothetical protein PspS35_00175 [Pseudomonas sp. S35]|uniref:hypothetical protein n=1 Tax=Pseudomonas sp. S35 TaxID=1573719 RepID=UPI00132EB37C|nr:hypothetical protein [Pseudomonas sp. S35]QHF42279.1 hypothetical protein PspS35_00175 [Pseudomonas sp. S35]
MKVNTLPQPHPQADAALASTTPTPIPPEKQFSSRVYEELKSLDHLSALLKESPYKNGYLRFSEDTGWKFSPNMSWRDKLNLRDAGFSKAAINPADMGLVKPGEEIARCNLLQRVKTKINSYPVTVESFEKTPAKPPVAKPHTSLLAANIVKPTPMPRTISPDATPTDRPIPALRLDIQKHLNAMDDSIQPPTLSSAPVEPDSLSIKERAQAWERRNQPAIN